MSTDNFVIDKAAGTVEFVFLIDSKTFEDAKERVYQKKKGDISLPGFRKGKAPRDVIEKVYGAEVFYNDAINDVFLSILFQTTYFGEGYNAPMHLSRHKILHGENINFGRKEYAVRCLMILDFLYEISKN